MSVSAPAAGIALGLRANWRQFTLLVIVNAFVGAMVGLERSLVPLIAGGLWLQAFGIVGLAASSAFRAWLVAAVLMGVGTALVYPTLLAAVGDVAAPEWRASAVGAYRLWRDGGYAVGALVSGLLADALGLAPAILAVAVITALSGIVVQAVMRETLSARPRAGPSRRGP